jgi:hypothetical protein
MESAAGSNLKMITEATEVTGYKRRNEETEKFASLAISSRPVNAAYYTKT